MMGKKDEAALWDDMDWGEVPSAATGPDLMPPSASGQTDPPPPPRAKVSPPPLPVLDAQESRAASPAPVSPVRPESAGSTLPAVHDPSPTAASAGGAIVHVPTSVATLTLASADGSERICTIERVFTVGRQPDNDLVIRDRQVSGHHARLRPLGDGSFELEDLDSSGGTFVNGAEVRTCVLGHGDRIEFASVVAYFHYIAGNRVEAESEFEETLVFRRPKSSQSIPIDPPPRRRVGVLRLPHADGGQSLLPVGGTEVAIGRAEDNDLVIPDSHVSGHHATIGVNADGEYEVVDLDSTCGTLVNGLSIIRCPLNHGDRITFGSVDCYFEVSEM